MVVKQSKKRLCLTNDHCNLNECQRILNTWSVYYHTPVMLHRQNSSNLPKSPSKYYHFIRFQFCKPNCFSHFCLSVSSWSKIHFPRPSTYFTLTKDPSASFLGWCSLSPALCRAASPLPMATLGWTDRPPGHYFQ